MSARKKPTREVPLRPRKEFTVRYRAASIYEVTVWATDAKDARGKFERGEYSLGPVELETVDAEVIRVVDEGA
jgi:hypothetical protein